MIDFDALSTVTTKAPFRPKRIFASLADKDPSFDYLRDVQGEVLDVWFDRRTEPHVALKMNVGSGKTVVGLLILQSCLAEGVRPAVYVVPDNYLVEQVMSEAARLGVETTDDPDEPSFSTGKAILVVNIFKLVNGRSVFGVGQEGIKKRVNAFVIDDAHACLESIRSQFRIRIPSKHELYTKIRDLFAADLQSQSPSAFRRIVANDPRPSYVHVPFWAWHSNIATVGELLFEYRKDDELKFKLDLIEDALVLCRCVVDSRDIEIAPHCIPIDVINSLAQAQRRIYMTATLADDSVLVTDFGADPDVLKTPVTPQSASDLGERMILMPQEIDPNFTFEEFANLLAKFAEDHNVVVIEPSHRSAKRWADVASKVLAGEKITGGVRALKAGHVGLVVLVNRYDGIDLPQEACRILAIAGLPEAESLIDRIDASQQGDGGDGLRRQMQRIEQGMGRGIRSNTDHCVVFLFGTKLVRYLLSPDGKELLSPATRAQLALSSKLAKQIEGGGMEAIVDAAKACLDRNKRWVAAHRRAIGEVESVRKLHIDRAQASIRRAFDAARERREPEAAQILSSALSVVSDGMMRGWVLARAAEITNLFDPPEAQKMLGEARQLNKQLLRPLVGALYEPVVNAGASQARAIRDFTGQDTSSTEWVLRVRQLCEGLAFESDTHEVFEEAMKQLGELIGFRAQRPERDFGKGPDVLWATGDNRYFIIECKNGAVGSAEVAKRYVDQLAGSMNWFNEQYPDAAGTPLMVHPKRQLDRTATPPGGMRVLTETCLDSLKESVINLATALAVDEVRSDVSRIKPLLSQYAFRPNAFCEWYTKKPKKTAQRR